MRGGGNWLDGQYLYEYIKYLIELILISTMLQPFINI